MSPHSKHPRADLPGGVFVSTSLRYMLFIKYKVEMGTIEAHIFSIRLGEKDLMALLSKVTEGCGILGRISAGKALIRAIKEQCMISFLLYP